MVSFQVFLGYRLVSHAVTEFPSPIAAGYHVMSFGFVSESRTRWGREKTNLMLVRKRLEDTRVGEVLLV